jgi:hypothetical protein
MGDSRRRFRANRNAVALGVFLLACGESERNGSSASNGGSSGATAGGQSGAAGTTSSGGSSGTFPTGGTGATTGGSVGTGGSGADVTGGAAGTPAACNELGIPSATRVIYPLPADAGDVEFHYASANWILATVVIGDSVRVVGIRYDDLPEVLLSETDYTPTWSEPTRVFATEDGLGRVDLLVSDQSSVAYVHESDSEPPVRVVELAVTNLLDLNAVALGGFGNVVFTRGEAPQSMSFFNARTVLTANPTGTDLTDAVEREFTTNPGAVRFELSSDIPLNAAASNSGAWLTRERMDPATDCRPAEPVPCSSGPMLTVFDCTFHVDIWHLPDDRFPEMPRGTFDSELRVVPPCGTTQSNFLTSTGLTQYDVERHHLLAANQTFPFAAIALQNEDPQNPTLRPGFATVSNGLQLFATDLAGLDISQRWQTGWITIGFACARGRCTNLDAHAPRQFDAPVLDFPVLGAVARPEGLVVYGRRTTPDPAIVAATLPCIGQ